MENLQKAEKKSIYKDLKVSSLFFLLWSLVIDVGYVLYCKHNQVNVFKYSVFFCFLAFNYLLLCIPVFKVKIGVRRAFAMVFYALPPLCVNIIVQMTNIRIVTAILMMVAIIAFLIINIKEETAKDSEFNHISVLLNTYKSFATLLCICGCALFVINGGTTTLKKSPITYIVDEAITIESTVEPTNDAPVKNNSYLKACLDDVTPLVDGSWEELDSKEKINIFQRIVNIEASYNGFSKPIKVCFADIDTTPENDTIKYGQYSDTKSIIYLNEKAVCSLSSESALTILLHEVYHAYQHEIVMVYKAAEEYKNLALLSTAAVFAEELENYKNGDDDYEAYKLQYIEITAQKYGEETAKEYCFLIEQYLDEKSKKLN